jgi:hypothetical protein
MDPPDKTAIAARDSAAKIIDDKTAEARERIGRIEASAGGAPMESEREFEESLKRLEDASRDLKERIAEERRRDDLPIDSALGDPEIERQNADGRNDLPDRDED